MTGEAHEPLHNSLPPIHHPLRDLEATDALLQALGERLEAYRTYFQ